MQHKTQKLAVTLWNYKGGVGKSTISLVLAQIAAQQGLRVLAVDLDEQQNLAHTLKLAAPIFPTLQVRSNLTPEFADEDFDFFVVDTHPAKDDTIKAALQFADIVLIPVLGDYFSIINLRSAIDYKGLYLAWRQYLMSNIISIVWDFDKTLIDGYMQEPIFKFFVNSS